MTWYSTTTSPQPDLRERRRLELERLIAFAAIDLFERNGIAATTVEDIAAAAGISRTTFFRHCATKESAVLIDEAGLERELVAAATLVSAHSALRELEQAWEAMTSGVEEDPEGLDRFLRVRRLMRDNPSLLAAGLECDARLTQHIADALVEGPGLVPLDAAAVAESFALGMRLSFDELVRKVDRNPGARPPVLNEVYGDVRAALQRANRGAAK
ncbi:TetR/AcrR family transcriptional regulator [Microbacterium sp. NPDC089698]|uniref:TetR/AcrR family transcriptional regulator n=1 Tax=Microbacterium sp. NPDC089698 TaxID=3364200 RepID=UPI0038290F77